ncbi:MAG: hypothetical protein HZA91_19225 [Verrucomicrobia bacterium]|nr:hypothetical protein [Verrucomicrobiota bacterium]
MAVTLLAAHGAAARTKQQPCRLDYDQHNTSEKTNIRRVSDPTKTDPYCLDRIENATIEQQQLHSESQEKSAHQPDEERKQRQESEWSTHSTVAPASQEVDSSPRQAKSDDHGKQTEDIESLDPVHEREFIQ